MKINAVTKEIIQKVSKERLQAENLYKQKDRELTNILMSVTGQEGFTAYEIKEDELILKFPEVKEEK